MHLEIREQLTDTLLGAAVASPVVKRQNGVPTACEGVDVSAAQAQDLTCPTIQGLSTLLMFQGDNVSGQSAGLLNEVLDLLGEDDPVSRVTGILTTGIVSSLVNGVSNQLYSVAGSISELNPECRCNAAVCLNCEHHLTTLYLDLC